MLLKIGGRVKSGPLSSPRERGPDLNPVPDAPPEVGASIPALDCDIRWAASDFQARRLLMSRDGAIIFADLIGKLDVLYVHCPKCSRAARYRVRRLIDERGLDGKLIDWLDEITADCPKKQAHNMNDPCGARFPDLPRVL